MNYICIIKSISFNSKYNNIMENIQELLDEKLTGKQLKELHTLLGLNLKQLTRRFSGKSHWNLPEIQKLSKLLDISVSDLVFQYGLGHKTITIDSLNQVLKSNGSEVGEVAHAA